MQTTIDDLVAALLDAEGMAAVLSVDAQGQDQETVEFMHDVESKIFDLVEQITEFEESQ